MMHHILKTHPAMFHALKRGDKKFEVRKDDRAFQTGDTIELVYHEPTDGMPAFMQPPMPYDKERETFKKRITFVLRGGQYGIEAGYVALSLADI